MIKRFEVGKSYRFIGGREPRMWNPLMDKLKDGKIRKCIRADYNGLISDDEGMAALFKGIAKNGRNCWCFNGDQDLFEEVNV